MKGKEHASHTGIPFRFPSFLPTPPIVGVGFPYRRWPTASTRDRTVADWPVVRVGAKLKSRSLYLWKSDKSRRGLFVCEPRIDRWSNDKTLAPPSAPYSTCYHEHEELNGGCWIGANHIYYTKKKSHRSERIECGADKYRRNLNYSAILVDE